MFPAIIILKSDLFLLATAAYVKKIVVMFVTVAQRNVNEKLEDC